MNVLKLFSIALLTTALGGVFNVSMAAKSWGITGEKEAKFKGTVVDITCHLSGNCPDNCGEGSRQIGLQTADQGIILVSKNLSLYSGAAEELWGFCGQESKWTVCSQRTVTCAFFRYKKYACQVKSGKRPLCFKKPGPKSLAARQRKPSDGIAKIHASKRSMIGMDILAWAKRKTTSISETSYPG